MEDSGGIFWLFVKSVKSIPRGLVNPALRVPLPRGGGGGGLGSFKRSIEPPGSHRLLVSCLLACLPIFGIDSRLLVRSFVHGLVGDEFVWWLEG